MNKHLASLLLLCTISVSTPVFAAEEDPVTSTALLPLRVASVGVGMTVGIPVCSLKQSARNIQANTMSIAESFGGKDDPVSLFFAAAPGAASGVVQGLAEGVYQGSKNALDNCVENPFSSESMSLVEE